MKLRTPTSDVLILGSMLVGFLGLMAGLIVLIVHGNNTPEAIQSRRDAAQKEVAWCRHHCIDQGLPLFFLGSKDCLCGEGPAK